MTRDRYNELERNPSLKLTKEEIRAGWRFCDEWDGMLIHKNWKESMCCTCCNEFKESSDEGIKRKSNPLI